MTRLWYLWQVISSVENDEPSPFHFHRTMQHPAVARNVARFHCSCGVINATILPTTYVVRGKIMFSVACDSVHSRRPCLWWEGDRSKALGLRSMWWGGGGGSSAWSLGQTKAHGLVGIRSMVGGRGGLRSMVRGVDSGP